MRIVTTVKRLEKTILEMLMVKRLDLVTFLIMVTLWAVLPWCLSPQKM